MSANFLSKQLMVLIIVSAGSVSSDNDVWSNLPASKKQIDDLAMTVCYDIEFYFQNQSLTACRENFKNSQNTTFADRPPLKVWCRFKEKIRFEVSPMDYWQLVVLIPLPITTDEKTFLHYRLIKPNMTLTDLSFQESERRYMLVSTVLGSDTRPALWRREADLPPWEERGRKEYDVRMQFVHNNDSKIVKGIFTWNRSGDEDICFDFENFCRGSGDTFVKLKPSGPARIVIENMTVNDECNLILDGHHGTTELSYKTPVMDIETDKPEIPRDVLIHASRDGSRWSVLVRWRPPRYPPRQYNVTLRTKVITTLVLPSNATEALFRAVQGESGEMYNVSIFALKGPYTAHTGRRAIFPRIVVGRDVWAGGPGAAGAAAALALLALALCWLRFRKRGFSIHKPQQSSESKPLEESLRSWESSGGSCESGGSGGSVVSGGSGGDAWEVRAERVTLHEQLGEGAFGLVHRATLQPNGKEVAVKMLKEFPSIEEIRAFRLEMELMKSVGAHPHVVSLVGCCSGKRPLIISEYCSRGDLLSFLRCSWDIMISKRNAKYYNNNIDTSEYRNDLFKCKSQMEQSKLVVNKLYEVQGVCDMELTSLDLLSFCRQIAMGMEFLASNRLVHRDLAARNVLLTADRTLKIADFGLSRDVYEENQYKQKGNGKMPVKWMALESLTRRIYTSQSDVWSFGVVVWEIVTVGGAPYPGVAAARLPRLLRAGYRMPRPQNCSAQLYELMVSCWRAEPRLRPTFSALHQRLDELLQGACADHYLSLELDDTPPPPNNHVHYFKMLLRGKRAWKNGESYERPLKAPQSNHYTSSPVTHNRSTVT